MSLESYIESGLLDEQDTAFLVFDLGKLRHRLQSLTAAFPVGTRHAVAIKSNPHPAVLSFLVDAGFALEAASMEEVELALSAGATPGNVVFDSPVKTRAEIDHCAGHCPGLVFNANCLAELTRLPEAHGLRVGLRINPLVRAAGDPLYDVSSVRSKFGVSIQEPGIVDACVRHGVTGLHMHVGSGATDGRAHLQALEDLLELADRVDAGLAAAGLPGLAFLDIGGGLSAEAGTHGMVQYGLAVGGLLKGRGLEVWTEFGHWIHHHAGSACSRIEYLHPPVEDVPGMAYLHLGADFMVRQVYHARKSLQCAVFDPAGHPRSGPGAPYDLVGPLCFAGDVLAEGVTLAAPQEGDWVRFEAMGANTFGLWSRHCSRSVPKVILRHPDGTLAIGSPRTSVLP